MRYTNQIVINRISFQAHNKTIIISTPDEAFCLGIFKNKPKYTSRIVRFKLKSGGK